MPRDCSECGTNIDHKRIDAVVCTPMCRSARYFRKRAESLRAQIDGRAGRDAPETAYTYR